MRLSEAIRLGSMLGPQASGALTRTVRRKYLFGLIGPKTTAYCALGAAYQAATGGRHRVEVKEPGSSGVPFRGQPAKVGDTVNVVETPDEWQPVLGHWWHCPACVETQMTMRRLIPHLNDDHKWTREQIAELVEIAEDVIGPVDYVAREQLIDGEMVLVSEHVTVDME